MRHLVLIMFLILAAGCSPPEKVTPNNIGIIEVPEIDVSNEPEPAQTSEEDMIKPADDIDQNSETEIQSGPSAESSTNQTVESNQSLIQSSRCFDSDVTAEHPDGVNTAIAGEILVNGKHIKNGKDYCTSTSQVSEWYCSGGIPRVQVYKCASSCKDGACL